MPRRGLDAAVVLATAAELGDREGLDAVTVTRVAAELGVRPPSLYNHVEGAAGMRRGIALLAMAELAERLRDAAVGRSGEAAMVAMARAYRAYAHSHPGRYAAVQRAPSPSDAALVAAAEAVVKVVGRVVAPDEADRTAVIHRVRAWRSAMHGFVDLELRGGFGLDVDLDESYDRLVSALAAAARG